MPPHVRGRPRINPAAPPSTTSPSPKRPRTRGNIGNLRYQNAVFSLIAERLDGTVIEGHTRPEPPPSIDNPQTTTTRQRTTAGNGPKPPTKASEARARKQQEKKRQRRLARNERETQMNNLSFVDEPREVNNGRLPPPPERLLHHNQSPPKTPVQSPIITPQQTRHVAFSFDHHGNRSSQPCTPSHTSRPLHNRTPSHHSAAGSNISCHQTPQSARSRRLFAPPKGKIRAKAKDVWFFFSKPSKQNGDMNSCKLCKYVIILRWQLFTFSSK